MSWRSALMRERSCQWLRRDRSGVGNRTDRAAGEVFLQRGDGGAEMLAAGFENQAFSRPVARSAGRSAGRIGTGVALQGTHLAS